MWKKIRRQKTNNIKNFKIDVIFASFSICTAQKNTMKKI